MGVRTIPQKYEMKCDGCGGIERDTQKVRPSGWAIVRVEQGAQDYSGFEVADGSIERWICPNCRVSFTKLTNEFFNTK